MKMKVTFKCCNTEHTFTRLHEYFICKCGKCGLDSGDGLIQRMIGPPSLIERKEVN